MSLISSSSRESVPRQTTRESSSRMKKRKKKNNNNNSWLFILSRLFRALFFLSLFFRDVSTLAFLHFFNPRNEERFRQSLSLDTRMQSIQSTVVVEVRFKFSLSFILSFFTSFVGNVLSLVAPFFPLPLPSSFRSLSVMMITFLDIFLDRLPGKRFVVLLFTLISLFSLSYARIPASNACE